MSDGFRVVRRGAISAKSPERFLYVDLPAALELPVFPDIKPAPASVECFFDALNATLKEWSSATPKAIRQAEETLLKACGLEGTDIGWQRLRAIARRLEPRTTDGLLLTFLRRVIEATTDDAGISSVLALVAGRPPANWTDADVERFPQPAQAITDPLKTSLERPALAGIEPAAFATLTPAQTERATTLARDLRKELLAHHTHAPNDVMRAALLILAASIREGEGT
jgi:hypothetical protein